MSTSRYAVINVCTLAADRWEAQQRGLHEQVVPLARQSPGFVAGYWTGDQATGTAYTTIILENEETACRFKAVVEGNPANREQAGVTMELLTVVEVVAEAHR